jgi:radical SAM superfamily enzyme YgiQ (UPF0313 family)
LKSGYFSINNSLSCDVLTGHLEWCFGKQVDVEIQDHRFMSDDELIHTLKQRQPNVIGLSAFIGSMENVKGLIQLIREMPPLNNSLIVVGNLLGTFAYKDILDFEPQVICVRGHGEIALQQICDVILRHQIQNLSAFETLHQNGIGEIRNLAYKDTLTQEVITTKRIPTLPNQTGPTKFTSIHDVIARGGSIDVRTSYGCTGHCSFCSVRELNGTRDYQVFPPERVADEFQYIYQQGYRKAICITDDNFWGRSLDQMDELIVGLESLKQEIGKRILFKISARADNVTGISLSHLS